MVFVHSLFLRTKLTKEKGEAINRQCLLEKGEANPIQLLIEQNIV